LHSGVPDPDMPTTDIVDVSLLDLKDEIANTLADPDHVNIYENVRVRFTGTVSGYADHILYIQDFLYRDEDDPNSGEFCGINVFIGMQSIASKYTTINTYLQIVGVVQNKENFGFQITDTQGHFPYGSATNEKDAQIIYYPDVNSETEHSITVIEHSASELSTIASANNPYDLSCLNCRVRVTDELVVEKVFVSETTDKDLTISFVGQSFNCYVPFSYKPDGNERWDTEEEFLGKKFKLEGVYVLHKTQSGKNKFQIIPDNKGLVWVQD